MALKEKLNQLTTEFTTLKQKITNKLQINQQTITELQSNLSGLQSKHDETNQKLTEANRKVELTAKENSENEKVLEKLLKEFKELAEQLK
jgi:hypothetical protein